MKITTNNVKKKNSYFNIVTEKVQVVIETKRESLKASDVRAIRRSPRRPRPRRPQQRKTQRLYDEICRKKEDNKRLLLLCRINETSFGL